MSVRMSSHLMSDDNEDSLNNLMTCCIQLLHHSQWKSARQFFCGSGIEIPLGYLLSEQYHMMDNDNMIHSTDLSAANRSVQYPEIPSISGY